METKGQDFLNFRGNEVIVITGGSGFLGQHIIRVIQEKSIGIKEIRVVDVVPYQKKLDYVDKIPIVYYKGDVSIEEDLNKPFEGGSIVIHTAAIVSVGHYVDRDQMKSVNIIGTSNVILKCKQWNISKLVLSSTVDAIIKRNCEYYNEIEIDGDLPERETDVLMGYYGYSKSQSEAIAICSRTTKLSNGKPLNIVVLRPTVLYGECDPYYVTSTYKVAKSCFGYLFKPWISTIEPILQSTYAGNAAWAHLLAAYHLPQISNQTFYITDDTKPKIIYDFMRPFLLLKGFKTINIPIPIIILIIILKLVNWFIQNIAPISFKKLLNEYPVFPTYDQFQMTNTNIHFNRKKATEILKYKPIYTEKEAKGNSAKYYKYLNI